MTPRQARRERRAAERKTKKAEIRRTKADLLANPDSGNQPIDNAERAHAVEEEDGSVSQSPVTDEATLLDWIASAGKRNFPNGLPAEPPAPEIEFVSPNALTSTDRAAINRANAQLSTGPRTIEGKLVSSRNSTKHGLASGQPIILGEDPAAFESLLADLMHDHQPANTTEKLLVNEMAQSYWLGQRAIRLQNGCFTEEGVDQRSLSLFLRYGTTHNRAFHKALADLQRLQKERRKAEQSVNGGFVSHEAAKRAVATGFVSQTGTETAKGDEFVRQNDTSTHLETGFVPQNAPAESFERRQSNSKAA